MTEHESTAEHPSVETGFNLERLYFHKLSLESVTGDELPDVSVQDATGIGWDWAWLTHDAFDVSLTLEMKPTRDRSEHIIATAIGRFRLIGVDTSLSLERFVQFSAPAVLFPYLRQQITALTSAGRYGPILLPPTNVQALMSRMDPAKTTAAAKGRPEGLPPVAVESDVAR